jgi:O-methyltransferase
MDESTQRMVQAAYQRISQVTPRHLADTFLGVVKAGELDTAYLGGEHSDTSAETIEASLTGFGVREGCSVLQGMFPEETGARGPERVALLHCDVDVDESCGGGVEWCLPHLVPGAVLVFDDCGFMSRERVTRFCNELRQQPGFLFIDNLNGHAPFVKTA